MRALRDHELGMNFFLRMASRLDDKPGYPWYVALFDYLGGYYTKITGRC